MDFLSSAWCNFAVQAFQPELNDHALVLHRDSIKKLDTDSMFPCLKMDKGVGMEDADRGLPPWKSNDVKSWIWMQQAMHPELNYNSCFKKKWMSWKIVSPIKNVSIKKWLKDIKERSKEGKRLQRAEVHAAVSVAGLAAALAAIAAENSKHAATSTATKEFAVASAAALVAAQCARVAEAIGAKKEQVEAAISSGTIGTRGSDILTLTAAATSSLRGAAALKVREGYKKKLQCQVPVLPIEDSNDLTFNFGKCKSVLAKGAQLNVETPDGTCRLKFVSVIRNREAKVVVRIKKPDFFNAFARPKESVVLAMQGDLYKELDSEERDACYVIILTTSHGIIKLDMMDNYERYKTWSMTISHMLRLTTYDM